MTTTQAGTRRMNYVQGGGGIQPDTNPEALAAWNRIVAQINGEQPAPLTNAIGVFSDGELLRLPEMTYPQDDSVQDRLEFGEPVQAQQQSDEPLPNYVGAAVTVQNELLELPSTFEPQQNAGRATVLNRAGRTRKDRGQRPAGASQAVADDILSLPTWG